MNRDVVTRELRGDAAAREECERDLEGWRDVLVRMAQEVEGQFSERSAEAAAFRSQCFARGSEGKAEWFAYEVEYLQWRRGASRFKRGVTDRLREVKAAIKARNFAGNNWRSETWAEVRAAHDAWRDGGIDTESAMRRIDVAFTRFDDLMDSR